MKTFRQKMTYHPPDIGLFHRFGRGYLTIADRALSRAEVAFYGARVKLLESRSWGSEPLDIPEKDLVGVYGYWAMADDMLKRLDRMEEPERKKQLELDTNERLDRTYTLILQRHADLEAQMMIDEKRDPVYCAALNRQLERRLDTWEKGLQRVEKSNFESEGEQFETEDDFCEERDVIEYACMGIDNMRERGRTEARLQALPYFPTFIQRRLKLDKVFERVLDGRFSYAPWAELPQFWWHHSPRDVERFIRNEEANIDRKLREK